MRDSGDVCGARNTQFDQEFFGLLLGETVSVYDWRDRIGDFCVADYLAELDTVHVMRYSTRFSPHLERLRAFTDLRARGKTSGLGRIIPLQNAESFGTIRVKRLFYVPQSLSVNEMSLLGSGTVSAFVFEKSAGKHVTHLLPTF